jgi:uncharacterized membrane protein
MNLQIVRNFGVALIVSICAGLVLGALVYFFLMRIQKGEIGAKSYEIVHSTSANRIRDILVIALFVFYVVFVSAQAIASYYQFAYGYDFSILDQVVWNSLNGRLLETSVTGLGATWLGTHFAPLLLALVPLFALFPDARVLLIADVVALASVVFPLYWFAQTRLRGSLAFGVALVFFLFSTLHFVALAGFHDVVLAAPIMAFAALFFYWRRWTPFFVCLGLSMLVREEAAFVIIAFGFISLLRRDFRIGLALVIAGFAWMFVVLQWVIPFFAGRGSNYIISLHYSKFGSTLQEVLTSILLNPAPFLATISTPDKLTMLLRFLVPLAFLPLLGWEFTFLSLPTLGYLLLLQEIYPGSHHLSWIIPFFLFGAVLGAERMIAWLASMNIGRWLSVPERVRYRVAQSAVATLVLVASLSSYYFDSEGPFAQHFDGSVFALGAQRIQSISVLRDQIPSRASLLTTGGITSFFSHRQHLYYLPFIEDYRPVDYILFDSMDCPVSPVQPHLILAQRRPIENLVQMTLDEKITAVGYTIVSNNSLRGGQVLRLAVEWETGKADLERYAIRTQLVDNAGHVWAQDEHEPYLPTGLWTAGKSINDEYTLRLSSTMPPGDYQITVALSQAGTLNISGNALVLTTVKIAKDKSSVTASDLQNKFELENPYFVDMADLRLLGFKSLPQSVIASDILHVGLYWRARAKPRGDYLVTVQLVDTSGRVQLTQTQRPAAGSYPTTQWDEGEVLLDWHDLVIPSLLASGDFMVRIVLNDSASNYILGQTELGKISIAAK